MNSSSYSYSLWKEDSNNMLHYILCLKVSNLSLRMKKVFLWTAFNAIAILRREKSPPPVRIFDRFNFFNTCEAMASVGVHQFGCVFLLWLIFFTKQVPDSEFNLIRHTLRGESTMKFINIWWSIEIGFGRIFSRFFQRRTMRVSNLRLCVTIMTVVDSFLNISSW